jgi:hypothetical protein
MRIEEILPPCGMPLLFTKSSEELTLSQFFNIVLLIGIFAISQEWLMLSKQPAMSALRTQTGEFFLCNMSKHLSTASIVDLSFLKPYEYLSLIVSDTGSRAMEYSVCIVLSIIVGMLIDRTPLSGFGMDTFLSGLGL